MQQHERLQLFFKNFQVALGVDTFIVIQKCQSTTSKRTEACPNHSYFAVLYGRYSEFFTIPKTNRSPYGISPAVELLKITFVRPQHLAPLLLCPSSMRQGKSKSLCSHSWGQFGFPSWFIGSQTTIEKSFSHSSTSYISSTVS